MAKIGRMYLNTAANLGAKKNSRKVIRGNTVCPYFCRIHWTYLEEAELQQVKFVTQLLRSSVVNIKLGLVFGLRLL